MKTSSRAELENYLFEKIAAAIRAMPAAEARDAYAFYLVLALDEGGGYRPSIPSLAWLTESGTTPEIAKNYGSRWSGWAASGETILTLCSEERDLHGFALQTAYYESLLPDESARARWEAFTFVWPFRWTEEMTDEEEAQLNHMLDALEVPAESRNYLSSVSSAVVPLDLAKTFFVVLEDVIRRLHAEGVIEQACGRPVPIGVMATNDVGYEFGFEPTRAANPQGLARYMEEWMLGETYAEIEARKNLEREIRERTPDEQAKYWAHAALEIQEFFGTGHHTPFIEDLEIRGLVSRTETSHKQSLHLYKRLQELLPQAVPHLVSLIEPRAGNEFNADWSNKVPSDHAEHLLSLFESIGPKGDRESVPEESIERLAALMQRLWPEYKAMRERKERTSACLQYMARVLHALRPDRFPRWRQNPRDAGDFNFADYGLS